MFKLILATLYKVLTKLYSEQTFCKMFVSGLHHATR